MRRTPLWGALVGFLWLRDRLSALRTVGLVIGFLGVLMLVWDQIAAPNGSAATPLSTALAAAAALGATLLYGIAANYTKRHLTGVDALTVATGTMTGATIVLLPLAVIYWPAAPISLHAWGAVIALGVACTGVAYMLFFHLIAVVGPARTITVTFVIPIFGILWGALFLGESVSPGMLEGCAVILVGTALATGVIKRLPGAARAAPIPENRSRATLAPASPLARPLPPPLPPQQPASHFSTQKNSPHSVGVRAKPSPYEDRRRGHRGRAPRAQAIIGLSIGSFAGAEKVLDSPWKLAASSRRMLRIRPHESLKAGCVPVMQIRRNRPQLLIVIVIFCVERVGKDRRKGFCELRHRGNVTLHAAAQWRPREPLHSLKRASHQGTGHFVRCDALCLNPQTHSAAAISRGAKAAPHTSARTSRLTAHIQ